MRQFTKDYVVFPALAGPFFLPVLAGNVTANLVRNLWSHAVPSNRYAEIAPEIRALCAEYGLEYTCGSLRKQHGQVLRTINRLALPQGRGRGRP